MGDGVQVNFIFKLALLSHSWYSAQVAVVSKPTTKVPNTSVLWDFEECSPYTVRNVYIWTHPFGWKFLAAFLRDQQLFREWSGRKSTPNIKTTYTAGARLFWWGKMLRQVVWNLPSHILPFQTVGSHDLGKILTICFQFCFPSKIIQSLQCYMMSMIVSDPVAIASSSIRFVKPLHMGSIVGGYRRPQRERSRSDLL